MASWSRRAALAGGGVLAAAGLGALVLRKPDRGGAADGYFRALSAALRAAGIAQPVMVIDQPRLLHNIAAIRAAVNGARLPLRVVVKSLPCAALLEAVAAGVGTNRFMVFNAAMLGEVLRLRPDADVLLGKPLPTALVAATLDRLGPRALAGVQWLADTPARIDELAALGAARGAVLRLSLEIDVGLHRGGFADPAALVAALDRVRAAGQAIVAGLMGYDAHVAKMADVGAAYRASQARYAAFRAALAQHAGGDPPGLTLNGAGSYTFVRHCGGTVANEVSVGSAFLKPADWEIPDNHALVPAAFIATPVIKAGHPLSLPGHEYLDAPLRWFDPNTAQAVYVFGGHWLADPVSPPGLQYSELIGHSSNQELLTASARVGLRPDDTVFLRPRQSEAVLLQFGDLAVFDGRQIATRWPTFPVSA